jgi:signal transduction histidine kinase
VRSRREGDEFILDLRDEGGPVPPGELARAFEPFSGLHQETVLDARGPGEALPACKQVLALYHGEITLENQDNGTLLRLRIPLR